MTRTLDCGWTIKTALAVRIFTAAERDACIDAGADNADIQGDDWEASGPCVVECDDLPRRPGWLVIEPGEVEAFHGEMIRAGDLRGDYAADDVSDRIDLTIEAGKMGDLCIDLAGVPDKCVNGATPLERQLAKSIMDTYRQGDALTIWRGQVEQMMGAGREPAA